MQNIHLSTLAVIMKTVLFAFVYAPLFAQTELKFVSLTSPDSTVAYQGYDNTIALYGIKISDSVHVDATYGTVYATNQNLSRAARMFLYKPSNHTGNSDTLTVCMKGKPILIRPLEVRKPVFPVPQLSGFPSGKINRDLLPNDSLFVEIAYPGSLMRHYTNITHALVRYSDEKYDFELRLPGNHFRLSGGTLLQHPFLLERIKNGQKCRLEISLSFHGTESCGMVISGVWEIE